MSDRVFSIIGGTQSYDWGKIGGVSKVAQYAKAGIPDFEFDESKPYAELWMGTHPNLPSRLVNGEKLSDHLKANTHLLGEGILNTFPDSIDGNLPFLFKILAIGKALSIQAHPDKQLAAKLHFERPDLYKGMEIAQNMTHYLTWTGLPDANHKPEMAIAITPFVAMCGFRPLSQIAVYLNQIPELTALVPSSLRDKFLVNSSLPATDPEIMSLLRDVFSAVMTAPEDEVKIQLRKLVGRYSSGGFTEDEKDILNLVVELDHQFPNDIGVFCVFLLNIIKLEPGQAIFLGAGEPHAYISGDIVETMATSDNVLRAGLTPKLRDVPNLVSSLTYKAADPSIHLIRPSLPSFSDSECTRLYNPPIREFSVSSTTVTPEKVELHIAIYGPSVMIVTSGTGQVVWIDAGKKSLALKEGSVIFIAADTPVSFEGDMTFYRAFFEG